MMRLQSRRESNGKNIVSLYSTRFKQRKYAFALVRRLEAFEGNQGRGGRGCSFLRLGCVHGRHAGFLSSPPSLSQTNRHFQRSHGRAKPVFTHSLRRFEGAPSSLLCNASSARDPPRAYYRLQQRLQTKRRRSCDFRFASLRDARACFLFNKAVAAVIASLAIMPSTATRCLRDLYKKCIPHTVALAAQMLVQERLQLCKMSEDSNVISTARLFSNGSLA